jgi:ribonuclease HIII
MDTMEQKVMRSSFLLQKALLPDLILFLGSYDIQKTPKKKFQLLSAKFMSSQLVIYKSGIVVFDESQNLTKILKEFFFSTHLPIPLELEATSNKLVRMNNDPAKLTRDDEISSFWLSSEQIEILITYYQNREYEIIPLETKNHLYKICKSNTNCIEISKNGLMKSNSISDYKLDLDFVLENHPIDHEGKFYIGIESVGKYSQLGPIVYTIVGISSEQSIFLQKHGIRHMKIGRNNDPTRYLDNIKKYVTFQKFLIIHPEDVNSNDFETLHSNKFTEFFAQIQQMIPDNILTVVYCDDNLKKDFLNYHLSPVLELRNSGDSMSSAAASVIARYHYNHWMKDKSLEYNLSLNKGNIEKIAKLPEKVKLLKLKYLSSER